MATGRDLAEQLLRRAADDEAAARAMLPLESVTNAIMGFHAQQAVEKSLKAVLAARDVDFPFIHDIGGLADLCQEAGVSLPEELAGVDGLTPYAAGLRYDDDQPGVVSRETALNWATASVDWARSQIRADESSATERPEISS
ncbi:MAG TPA: HEPN domain-containing protein [Solirubrobacteraceae bacterium]